jgi:hypothetical protein
MIGQILSNNNEKCYSNFSHTFREVNTPLAGVLPQPPRRHRVSILSPVVVSQTGLVWQNEEDVIEARVARLHREEDIIEARCEIMERSHWHFWKAGKNRTLKSEDETMAEPRDDSLHCDLICIKLCNQCVIPRPPVASACVGKPLAFVHL